MNETLSHQEYLSYTLHSGHQHAQHVGTPMMHQYGSVQQQYGVMAQTGDLLQQAASGLLATEAPEGVLLTLPSAQPLTLPSQYTALNSDLSHVLVSTQNSTVLSPPNSTSDQQNSRSNSANLESSGLLSGGSSHSSSSSSSSKKKRTFPHTLFSLSFLSV